MEITLITGATAFEAAKNTIKKIDKQNLEMQNLVVVPDAFSMQAENLIFDQLGIKATFNIEVVGISRLASKILRDNNIAYSRISGLEEIFNIFKAVQQGKEQFTYFKNSGVDFCLKVLQIIKQFKSCKISPQRIKAVGDENLDSKMHDLKIIYENYENLIADKFDLSKLLDFFAEKTEKELNLSKINLFFINFDSFSQEISSFICRLAARVNAVFIGMAKPISANNAFIYDDDILKKVTLFAKENKVPVQVEVQPTVLQGNILKIVENLFAFAVPQGQSDGYFTHIVAKNKKEEVEILARYIKWQVVQGKKFKDFAVAVADEKYIALCKEIFAEYGIAFYSDDAANLLQTVLGRFVCKFVSMAKTHLALPEFQFLASSPLLGKDEDVLAKCFYYDINDEKEFESNFPQYKNVLGLKNALQKCKTVRQFSDCLKTLLGTVEANFLKMLAVLEEKNLFKEQSENQQSLELLRGVLDKLCEIAANEEISLADFQKLLELSLQSVKVETIPTYVDAVYVANATESYFEDVHTLFVLGATANALPMAQADTGIIDDDDIKKLSLSFMLEPEIKVINRRKRMKLFELLQHGQNKLIVCTPINDGAQQTEHSGFVNDLLKMFGGQIIHSAALEQFGVFNNAQEFDKVLFQVGCWNNLLPFYTKFSGALPANIKVAIKASIKGALPILKKHIQLEKPYFPLKNSISASELETYFHCPYRHLLQYILKIQPKQNILPTKMQYGSFLHDLLKTFGETFAEISAVTDAQIEKFLNENLMALAQKQYDGKVLQKTTLVNFLKNESRIVLRSYVKEQAYSHFKPKLLEEKVWQPFAEGLNLIGFVDRVDVCGDYFRIIDFKTGETGTILSELMYGQKLQLFLYAGAIAKKTKLKCAGVYYFDCRSKYGKNSKLLNGLTLKDDQVVLDMDSRLADEGVKSGILGMSRKKKADDFAFKDGKTVEDFGALFDYANKICEIALQEMKQGFAEGKPFKDACQKCPYISICKHTDADGFRVQQKKRKVTDGT